MQMENTMEIKNRKWKRSPLPPDLVWSAGGRDSLLQGYQKFITEAGQRCPDRGGPGRGRELKLDAVHIGNRNAKAASGMRDEERLRGKSCAVIRRRRRMWSSLSGWR